MKVTLAFLYRWTHIPTHKWYIGSRSAVGCHPDDGYICSSKIVKPMILENRTDWKREVLLIGNPTFIRNLESEYLSKIDAKNDPMSFNQHNGDGKFTTNGMPPWNKSLTKDTDSRVENYAKKVSLSRKGKCTGIKNPSTRPEVKAILRSQKIGIKNPMFGKEAWNKGSSGQLMWVNNGTVSKQVNKDQLVDGFAKGRNYVKRWFTDGATSLQCIPGTEPTGFAIGRKIQHDMSYDKSKYKWFTDGVTAKRFIPGTEPANFIAGRSLKSCKMQEFNQKESHGTWEVNKETLC